MTIELTQCDECDKQRDEANHWFQLWVFENGHYASFPPEGTGYFETTGYFEIKKLDFCGQSCLLKYIARITN